MKVMGNHVTVIANDPKQALSIIKPEFKLLNNPNCADSVME